MGTTRAAIYLRVSQDRTGEQLSVSRHRDDCQRIARERGWRIVAEYVDNGLSASDKRKDRPGYDAMVKAYQAGEFDALVCWDLDRLTRQPRQLEDWVDAAEERGLLLVTANGEADLSTDGGRLFARIKAAVARAEMERKGARQRSAAIQRADRGRPPLGVRLTGYTSTGDVVATEAAMVAAMFGQFHAGASLKQIVRWLTVNGYTTRHGRPWNPSSVRDILLNARYCGRSVYMGKDTGKRGAWEPIVDEALFDAVNVRLTDPRRRLQQGTDRKHLGSGLYLCGVCDRAVRSYTSAGAGLRYRCPQGCVSRRAALVDELVLEVIRTRLARPDLADLLAPPRTAQAREAAEGLRALRGRLVRIEGDYDAGLIDGTRFKVASDKVRAEIAAAEAAQVRLLGSNVAGTLTAPDPVAAFDGAPVGVRQSVVRFFVTVRLLPAPRGKHFVPESIHIGWSAG